MKNYIIDIDIELITPLHIGAGKKDVFTDAWCLRDGIGNLIIPGTSVAGVFRARAAELITTLNLSKGCLSLEEYKTSKKMCQCAVCRLFGEINPDVSSEKKITSKLVFHDSEIQNFKFTAIRDSIGVNRDSKTADKENSAKYDFEYIPAGSTCKLQIQAKDIKIHEELLLAVIISELHEGRIRLGGNSSRGLGRVAVKNVTCKKLPQCTADELEEFMKLLEYDDWLKYDGGILDGWYKEAIVKASGLIQKYVNKYKKDESLKIEGVYFGGRLVFKSPFITKANEQLIEMGYDSTPAVTVVNDSVKSYIPGSSLRGILRFQGERILRTLASLESKEVWDAACDIFSKNSCSEKYNNNDKIENKSCLACSIFGNSNNGSRLKIEDALSVEELKVACQDFIAVDRFTGGVADGKKFDTLSILNPTYSFNMYINKPEAWELALILFVLKDINDGLIQIGANSSKGYGRAEFNDLTLKYIYLGNNSDATIFSEEEINVQDIWNSNTHSALLDLLNTGIASLSKKIKLL